MEKVSIIGIDLAKRSFQAHGAHADGGVAFRKKLSREKVLAFLAESFAHKPFSPTSGHIKPAFKQVTLQIYSINKYLSY